MKNPESRTAERLGGFSEFMRADTTGPLEAVTAGLRSVGAALADSIAQGAGKDKGARRAQSALNRAKGVQKWSGPARSAGPRPIWGVHGRARGVRATGRGAQK